MRGAQVGRKITAERSPGVSNYHETLKKNQVATKKFLNWVSSKDIFNQWFVSQQGYTCGPTKMWEDNPVWNVDPIMAPLKKIPVTGRPTGYAGPPNRKAAEAQTKYIVVDMYAKAIQGMDAGESVKIYGV